jgi:trehalose 6-phosphate phosphatase
MSDTTLLAFDFDGTLAPIHEDPSAVRINRAAATLLAEASAMPGVVVAIVTGRDADDIAARVDVTHAYVVASHGLEVRAPGGVCVRDTARIPVAMPSWLSEAVELSGLRVERKKHGIALHWRGEPYIAIEPLVDVFREWAELADLDVVEGRCVLEARCRGGGKEEALRWLVSAVGATRVIYAGDDITDFGALRYAATRGRGVFVASAEREAPDGVTIVHTFRELFRLVRQEVMI